MTEQPSVPPPAVDPMKGFRGVMAGTLVMEAIVVALALLVISRLYGGLGTAAGIIAGADVAVLVVLCGLLRFRWSIPVVLLAQLVLIGCIVTAVPVGVIGLLFGLIWAYLLWLRHKVARRMAEGTLPGQQPSA